MGIIIRFYYFAALKLLTIHKITMRSQKILNYGRFIAIAFVIAIVPSCSYDNEDQIRFPESNAICELSSSDAEYIFNSEIEKLSDSEEPSKFGGAYLSQGLIEADWSRSASYRGTRTGIDNCEAPLISEQSLIFYVRDDKGGRISLDSHQRVVIVKNPQTGNEGVNFPMSDDGRNLNQILKSYYQFYDKK